MNKSFVLLILAVASVCLEPRASAQVQGSLGQSCSDGSQNQTPAAGWGTESTCGCDGIRGGALLSSDRVGFLWSQGKGKVALYLIYKSFVGAKVGITALRPNGELYVSVNGTGLTESIVVPTLSGWTWTGQYRATCYPPDPPGPFQLVRARCQCAKSTCVTTSTKALCLRAGDTVQLDVDEACRAYCRRAPCNSFAPDRVTTTILGSEGNCSPNGVNTEFDASSVDPV